MVQTSNVRDGGISKENNQMTELYKTTLMLTFASNQKSVIQGIHLHCQLHAANILYFQTEHIKTVLTTARLKTILLTFLNNQIHSPVSIAFALVPTRM
jgi:hypothetical protein